MNYLKYALARNNKKSHAEPVQPPIEEHRELRKRMKTIDIEEEIGRDEESIRNDVHLLQLSRWLKEAYLRDGNAPTDSFCDHIISEYKEYMGGRRSQQDWLAVIIEKINLLLFRSEEGFKQYTKQFKDMLENRQLRLQQQEKKEELGKYDQINERFRKKNEHTDAQEMQTKANKAKHDQEANLKSSGNIQDLRKTNSLSKDKSESDIKLSRLLSNEKPLGVNARKVEEDSGLQSELRTEESVSFSTALGSNMTVRRRDKPPGKTIKVDLPLMNGMVNKNNDKNDAFIFFRPKKGKS